MTSGVPEGQKADWNDIERENRQSATDVVTYFGLDDVRAAQRADRLGIPYVQTVKVFFDPHVSVDNQHLLDKNEVEARRAMRAKRKKFVKASDLDSSILALMFDVSPRAIDIWRREGRAADGSAPHRAKRKRCPAIVTRHAQIVASDLDVESLSVLMDIHAETIIRIWRRAGRKVYRVADGRRFATPVITREDS